MWLVGESFNEGLGDPRLADPGLLHAVNLCERGKNKRRQHFGIHGVGDGDPLKHQWDALSWFTLSWFTEGFDTPVLQDAKALLDELR
jgi:hypothetical protein